MSNLLDTVKSKVGYSLAEHSAHFFGEEQSDTSTAVDGTFAAIVAGMIQRVSYDKGAKDLHKILSNEKYRDYDIEDIFTRSPQTVNGLVNRGQHFLPSIYPGKLREASNSVATESGVKKLTSSKMMKISAPLLLSVLGKHVQENNLDVNGLKSYLNAQKGSVESGVPKGFMDAAELSAFGWKKKAEVVEPPKPKVKKAPKPKKVVEKVEEKVVPTKEAIVPATTSVSTPWWKWLLLLLLLLVGAWLLATKILGCGADKLSSTVAATLPIEEVGEAIGKTGEGVNKAMSGISTVLGGINEAAKTMLDKVEFAAGSAGEQMMNYISKGGGGEGRFRFNNLTFATGSANIDGTSGLEVDNMAAILKTYEDVKVRIEGYTDNRGSADGNLQLSKDRAESVRTRLISLGINEGRITTQGFGADNPIGDNETPEGRAQNRRIEIVVIK